MCLDATQMRGETRPALAPAGSAGSWWHRSAAHNSSARIAAILARHAGHHHRQLAGEHRQSRPPCRSIRQSSSGCSLAQTGNDSVGPPGSPAALSMSRRLFASESWANNRVSSRSLVPVGARPYPRHSPQSVDPAWPREAGSPPGGIQYSDAARRGLLSCSIRRETARTEKINAVRRVHQIPTGQPWHRAGHDDRREACALKLAPMGPCPGMTA